MKIGICNDHAAVERKQELLAFMQEQGHEVVDFGAYDARSVDYPDIAVVACRALVGAQVERLVLVCGTGVGMSIIANKVKGVRCALCSESLSAMLTRQHNDSNALAMGARTLGSELAKHVLQTWLVTPFSGDERHSRRIEKISAYEMGQ